MIGWISAVSMFMLFSAWLSTPLAPQLIGQSFLNVNTHEKVVALTFDDGPNPEGTPAMLDLLARYHIHATFFLIGQKLKKNPDLAKKILIAGHQVGNHSWSHSLMIFKTPWFIRREIEKTDRMIKKLGYKKEIFFRAPYGMKLLMLPIALKILGKKNILFDAVAYDWNSPGVEAIVENVMNQVGPGSIVLLHDGVGNQQDTVQATEIIINRLMSEGYRFVTVNELLGYHERSSVFVRFPKACLNGVKFVACSCAKVAQDLKKLTSKRLLTLLQC